MTDEPVGAHWIRAALQVNPYAYKGRNAPSSTFNSEEEYNAALLDECIGLGIELIAITDHWCVDSAIGLIGAAKERGIVALPGFEANSSEGVHILVIFEAETESSVVNAAIGACGDDVHPGCANGTTGKSFKDILENMTNRGALVIPAHVNVPNSGMLTGRSGTPLVTMVKDSNLHAIAVTPSMPDGTDQQQIVKGLRPYDRKHPLAVIYADDIMHPDQLKSDGATTWFKVSSSRVESLRLAVRTPETRVALSDPTGAARPTLQRISWVGGFLDGVTVPLSSDLTAVIGGRGTGKSTVIESLRYALGLNPIGSNAARDHKAIIEKVLRSGTIVKVDIQTVSPTPRRLTIERVVPNPPVVRDTSGAATNQQPADVVGSVEIFGQHELAELAGDPRCVADMLQRFAGKSGQTAEHLEVVEKLAKNREQMGQTEQARNRLNEELGDIPRLDEQVQQFRETDVAKRLEAMQRFDRDQSVFDEGLQRTVTATTALRPMREPQLDAALTADYEGLADSPQKEILTRVTAATTGLAAILKDLATQAQTAIEAAATEIGAAKTAWQAATKEHQEGHAEVLRKLHEEGLEPDKYLDVSRALDELRAKQPRLASIDETLRKLQKERDLLLGELAGHERLQLEELHNAIRTANDATGGVVVVRPIAAPDRSHITEIISNHISGQRTQVTAAVGAADFSPRSLASAIRTGATQLEEMGIRGMQSANLIAAGESLARELEEQTVGHAVEVLLDVSANGEARELKKIDELSKGQRATALLLLLLGASTAPLVIDQPEDDLDNRFVYDGVVANLRKLKGVRQIIASTHNANVPVLGDAELIVALEGDGQHGRPINDGIGSLDDSAIRSLAEILLEGGPAAFNARQHLYGF